MNEATVMAPCNGQSEKQPFSTPVENVEEWLEPRIQPRIHNGYITALYIIYICVIYIVIYYKSLKNRGTSLI